MTEPLLKPHGLIMLKFKNPMSIQNNINGGVFGTEGYITGVKYPSVFGSDLAIGDTDLYTAPAGKSAIIIGYTTYAQPAAAVDYYLEVKSGGTYYRLTGTVTATSAGASTNMTGTVIINAGESFSINAATNIGLNIWLRVIEFSTESNFKSANFFGLQSGNNTVYTVPAGKSAISINPSFGVDAGILLSNVSGGTRVYNITISGNDMTAAENTGNNAVRTNSYVFSMTAAQTVVVSSNSSAGTQAAFLSVIEI